MDLRWLDDVLVLLEEGNLTRAAARRNVTQPAFSRRIRSFETWLGASVVDRKTNRVGISPALASNEAEIRALASRLTELRTKIANYEPNSTTITIAAQHAPVHAMFSDMALRAKAAFPGLNIRLRAGNLNDCVSMFLRGDTSMLLCYEARARDALEFGPNVQRVLWGNDYLVPVVGGALRYAVSSSGAVPEDTPSVVYPDNSYIGDMLQAAQRPFSTTAMSANPVCVTAYTSGIYEMALKGLGIGWVPFSMAHRALETGDLMSLASSLGREPLDVAIYADAKSDTACALSAVWSQGEARRGG